jgi:hypothetical protein
MNAPYQICFGNISDKLTALLTLGAPNGSSKIAGTVYSAVVTNSGTFAAGAVFVTFDNTGTTSVTVNGTTLKQDRSMSFPTSDGVKLPAIAYNATGGELTINATIPPA